MSKDLDDALLMLLKAADRGKDGWAGRHLCRDQSERWWSNPIPRIAEVRESRRWWRSW